jgi:hypothetical protein
MDYTTIQVGKRTRARLTKMRLHPRQTYDELLNGLMDLVPKGDDESEYTDAFRASLLRGLMDIRQGRTRSSAEVRKHLGI